MAEFQAPTRASRMGLSRIRYTRYRPRRVMTIAPVRRGKLSPSCELPPATTDTDTDTDTDTP
ncbi:hypothetical protein ACI1US_01501 [Leucobacter sp. BZR 635]